MSALEGKERDLNRLKVKVDVALKNNHPASDKIEVCTVPMDVTANCRSTRRVIMQWIQI